jgi:Zn-finger nucleic acid-binding protein
MSTASLLKCPHCAAPMAHLGLQGHYDAKIALDHCDACRLLWFDQGELGRLTAKGWLQLLQHLVDHAGDAPQTPVAHPAPDCPRCQRPLQRAHDQTIYGRFVGLACAAGHGSAQRDAALFSARGLFRRLMPFEQSQLSGRAAPCLACGAPREPGPDECSYCGSPPVVVDLKRLSQSLGLTERRSTIGQGEHMMWNCQGCGKPVDATQHTACPQCQHPVVALDLQAVAPLLALAAAVPPPAPVQARIDYAEALLAHERLKRQWQEEARPRSPAVRALLAVARLLMGRRG